MIGAITITGAALVAAVDLGGTKLHVALGDLLGAVLAETLEPTDPAGGLSVLERIAAIVGDLLARAGAAPARLRLTVLGTPGVLGPDGRVQVAPNIPGLDRIDVPGALAERLGVPLVIENDVNLAATGEALGGHGPGIGHFAFIALGTGIGMGIVADGRLLRGARGAAGEICYLAQGGDPYDPRGFTQGTFETAVGSAAIADRFAGYGGRSGASVAEIFAALAGGDPAAAATVEETARLLAPAIASVGALLDPELVVLGGSIGARPELLAAVRRFLPRCTPAPPRVETSLLGNRASLTGALGLGSERIQDQLFGVDALVPAGPARRRGPQS